MANDYIVFIHGVDTREPVKTTYADYLFGLIQTKCLQLGVNSNLVKVPLFWGNIPEPEEQAVLEAEKQSPIYDHIDLRKPRETVLLPFVGDAVSYISRALGARIVEALKATAQPGFVDFVPHQENRLHLVTHSWGTVILFDILFADRWDDPNLVGAQSAMELRDIVFGVEPSPLSGLVVRSIHTMGSPLDIFSLYELIPTTPAIKTQGSIIKLADLNAESMAIQNNPVAIPPNRAHVTNFQNAVTANPNLVQPRTAALKAAAATAEQPNTHAISKNLNHMLELMYAFTQKKLPWYNFVHPGDLVAYPIAALMNTVLGPALAGKYLNNQDFLVTDAGPQFLENVDPLAILRAGDAHGSYWKSHLVAEQIARCIASA